MAASHQSPDPSKHQHPYSSLASKTPSRALQASSRLRLRLTGLPPQTSTLDIYENLYSYGSIVRINLFETREGLKSTRAEVDFQPAPIQEFWRRPLLFETRSHQSAEVHFQTVNNLPQVFTKESPSRKGVRYNDRTELYGKALDFGVLVEPAKMMVMGRSGNLQNKPKLVLNLHRREIEIHFPWQQISRNRSAIRTFRFNIALDAEVKIWELADHSFVIHLAKPPWYSKQLAEAIANTHSPDARLWTIEDTWARQTDLWTYKQSIPEINTSPITLAKHLNDINIFRWTTFRFDPINEHANMFATRTFVDALRDWNVKVQHGADLHTFHAEPGLDKKVWKLINGTVSDGSSLSAADQSRLSLPFAVRYQLEVCLSHGWLSEYSLGPSFFERLAQLPEMQAKQALLYVAIDQKRLFDPNVIFKDIHYSKPVRAKRLPDNCIEICSATVTTTGILFNTPAVEITNRIIRNHKSHAHRFLRVRFEDDDYRGQTRLYPSTNNKMVMIFTRVKRALAYGIKLGDILYEFLAWGNSQLREHGAYFFAAADGLTADSIRAEMGNFEETVVAKKAARMGQCFSTTRPVHLQLKMIHESDTIPDVVRNGYTFTDGVGKISPAAAELVASQLQIKGPTPCLFQFRLGGCKGVLAVSSDVPGVDIRIRKSQLKFKSLANELEINRYAQFWQACLNRQIILCLSSLGVPTEVFIRRQRETIAALNRAINDDGAAINALRSNVDPNMMTLELSRMVEAGFRSSQEPFVVSLLELWRAWSLKYLKEKAKIPIEEGAFVLGTVDETASLRGHTNACPSGEMSTIMADPTAQDRLPEIFLQITDHKTGERRIIEGLCILARNPSLHRGDIRIVRARNVPALHHMCDVVVMPQLGDRDLSSMCSGGDLDGDDYIVIWAKDLIPSFWNAEPFHYEPSAPKVAAGEIKTSDLIDFFHDYMQNDALGKIATAHMAAADYFDDGLENRICLDLVQLHSMAVDYPKTGVPAKMERRLERPDKPHFMEPYGKPYFSRKVLGQLYDEIDKFYQKLQKGTFVKHDLGFDERILNSYEPDATLLSKVETVKHAYDISLQRILTQHSIQTEFELWSTFVLEHSKKSRDYKFHEEVGDLSRVLKEEYYEELCDLAGGRDFDHLAPVAVAAYKLTQKQLQAAKLRAKSHSEDESAGEATFISFPWLLQDTLIKIASQIDNRKSQVSAGKESLAEVIATHVEGQTAEGLYDIADFHLTRDKLSPYLSDPLTTNIVDPSVDTTNRPDVVEPAPIIDGQVADFLELSPDDQNLATQASTPTPQGVSLLPPGEASINLPERDQECIADRTSWDMVSRPSEDGGYTSLVEGQSRSNSSEAEHAQPKRKLQHTISSSKPSDQSLMLMADVPTSPRMKQTTLIKPRSRRQATCFYWKTRNDCRYTAQECKYAHYDTGTEMLEKQQITCYYWLNGDRCTFDDTSCKFAHHDTGYHAPRPHGTVNSKSQDGSTTRRVVTESSGSEDEDERCTSFTCPRDSLTPKALRSSNGTAKRPERNEGHTGLQPRVSFRSDPATDFAQQNGLHKSTLAHQDALIDAGEEHSQTYINDALAIHGISREPPSSPRLRRVIPEANVFVPKSNARSAYPARVSVRTKPTNQLIDILDRRGISEDRLYACRDSASQFHSNHSKRLSWAEDLQGLIFDPTNVAPPMTGMLKENQQQTPPTMDPSYNRGLTSSHNDLADFNLENSRDSRVRANESVTGRPSTTAREAKPEAQSDLLLDLLDDLKPDKSLRDPLAGKTSQSAHLPSTIDLEMTPKTSSKLVENNTYGDPLASHDVDDEPEIEEIFD